MDALECFVYAGRDSHGHSSFDSTSAYALPEAVRKNPRQQHRDVSRACKALITLNHVLRGADVSPASRATIKRARDRLRLRLALLSDDAPRPLPAGTARESG